MSVGAPEARSVAWSGVRWPSLPTYTYRYWHREALSVANLQWVYQSSSVVTCG